MHARILRRLLTALVSALATLVMAGAVQAAPLRVVATLSTFADLVKQIGGDEVEVNYIASPKFNPHFIEPKPSDVLKVKRADLFVHAGLDLELWRWPLVDAAGNPAVRPGGDRELDLSQGVRLLEVPQGPLTRAAGDIHLYGNPHYWLDPENSWVMAKTIATKLSELDPSHATAYQDRARLFLERLEGKIAEWKTQLTAVQGKEAIGYHRSWPYLAAFSGISVEQFLEPKPGIPPTPKHLALLEEHIRRRNISAILQETFVPQQPSQALARKTGIRVVTLCQNVGEISEIRDYLGLMDYNVRQLVAAMEKHP